MPGARRSSYRVMCGPATMPMIFAWTPKWPSASMSAAAVRSCPAVSGLLCSALERLRMLGRGSHHRLGDVHLLVLGLRRRDGLGPRRPLWHGGPDRAGRVGHAGVRRADDAGDRRPGEQDDPGDEEEDREDVRAHGPDGLRAAVEQGLAHDAAVLLHPR